jgi:hypothetical protein
MKRNSITKLRLAGFMAAAFGGAAWVFASPEISVDTATYDLGVIYEGKMSSATHVFKVKNTGDSTLFIKSVKPG